MIAAGVLSSHGQMNPWLAFLACVIGALAGDTVMYWLGRHFGRSILREQSWWAKIIHPEREAKIEEVIKKHGLKVLFSSRFWSVSAHRSMLPQASSTFPIAVLS